MDVITYPGATGKEIGPNSQEVDNKDMYYLLESSFPEDYFW